MASRSRIHLRRFLIFIVVLLLIGTAVRFLFPGERIGGLVANAISGQTGGTAVFRNVTIGLKPDLRIILSDGVIAGTGEQLAARMAVENDIVKYLMRFESLEISVSWREMLARKLKINRITLRAPLLDLITRAPDPDAPGASGSGTQADSGVALTTQGESGAGMAMVLAGFEIRDGSIKFLQLGTGVDLIIEDWQQDVSPGDLGVIAARLEGFQARRPSVDRVVEDARLKVVTRLGKVSIATAELPRQTFFDIRLQADIILPNAADHIGIDLQEASWSGLLLKGTIRIEPDGVGYLLSGNSTVVDLDINALVSGLVGALPQAEQAPVAWALEEDFTLEAFKAEASFSVPLPRPVPDDLQDILYALQADVELRGLSFQPPGLEAPITISAMAQLSRGVARIGDLKISDAGGSLTGSMVWRDFPAETSMSEFEMACNYLPVSILDRYLVNGCTNFINGEISGSFTGSLGIKAKKPDWPSLKLGGLMSMRNGVIHGTQMLDNISQYLGNRQDLKEIHFKDLEYDLRIDAGKYHLDNLKLEGPDTDWRGRGWFEPQGRMDMLLGVKFPGDFQPDLGVFAMFAETLRDKDGRLTLDMHLTGRAARPDVALDLSTSQKSVEEGAKRVIKGFLDKLKSK